MNKEQLLQQKMLEMKLRFLSNLPEKMVSIQSAWEATKNAKQFDPDLNLQIKLHSLAGAAGTFGFMAISEQARLVELAVADYVSAEQESELALPHIGDLLAALLAQAEQDLATKDVPHEAEDYIKCSLHPLVYYVEDDLEQANYVTQTLKDEGYEIRHFKGFEDFKSACEIELPAVFLVDMYLAEGRLAGAQLLDELKELHETLPPAIFLSIYDDIESRLAAFHAGASRYIIKPAHPQDLLSALDQLTFRLPSRPYRALLVDDDELLLEKQSEILIQAGIEVKMITDPMKSFEVMEEFKPDIFILDVYMPNITGPELAAMIRGDERYNSIPILFLSGEKDLGKQLIALNLGGDDFIVKPVNPAYFQMTVISRVKRAREYIGQQQALLQSLQDQKKLKKSQEVIAERLSRSQKFAKIGTWERNLKTDALYGSELIARLLGSDENEITTTFEHFINVIHPEDRECVLAEMDGCIQGESINDLECRVVWPDGTVRWIRETGNVVYDALGFPQRMLGVVIDVHDRRVAEIEREQASEKLREAQSLAKLGYWEANFSDSSLVWSDAIYDIFEFDKTKIDLSIDFLKSIIHSEDIEQVNSALSKGLETGYCDTIYRVICGNGKIKTVHSIGKEVVTDVGSSKRVFSGSIQDISELNQAREAADEANKAKSIFLSSMSHELRTPMNAILGFAQLLEIDTSLNAEKKQFVGNILEAGNHLLHLINDVLDLAKIESGNFDLVMEDVAIKDQLESAIRLVDVLAKEKDISIQVELPNHLSVQADHKKLTQVFINFLTNAIKYNHAGGFIKVSSSVVSEKEVKIVFEDSGFGIAVEKQDELFKPFNRLGQEASSIEGTGIGLSICKALIELMGGSISVESEAGKGSVFTLYLQRASFNKLLVAIQDTESATIEDELSESTSNKVVLYIEDTESNIVLMEHIFANFDGYTLKVARHPHEGLYQAEELKPDLILLDINLPDMDGYEVLKQLKENTLFNETPVIALTANAMNCDYEKGNQAGFDEYITKPISIKNLLALIRSHL